MFFFFKVDVWIFEVDVLFDCFFWTRFTLFIYLFIYLF